MRTGSGVWDKIKGAAKKGNGDLTGHEKLKGGRMADKVEATAESTVGG